jgi:hypothetical protein
MNSSEPLLKLSAGTEERDAAIREVACQFGTTLLGVADVENLIQERIRLRRMRQDLLTAGRFREYLKAFSSYERLQVMLDELVPVLMRGSPHKLAALLRDEWAELGNVTTHATRLTSLFVEIAAHERLLFTHRSWQRYQSLPDRITVYHWQDEPSLCWTASKTRANFSARSISAAVEQRVDNRRGCVRTHRIRKSQIMFVCLERKQEEIVLRSPL